MNADAYGDALDLALAEIQRLHTTRETAMNEAYAEGRKDEREEMERIGAVGDCPTCKGAGEYPQLVIYHQPDVGGDEILPCPKCKGTGFAPRSKWQPIETAPTDGTEVLLWIGEPVVGYFAQGKEFPTSTEFFKGWTTGYESDSRGDLGYARIGKPTHWMQLPEPPA